MKVETRGKFPGVKVHLDPDEVNVFLDEGFLSQPPVGGHIINISHKLGMKLRDLLKKEPGLLGERTPEQVAAILAKEVEKASLQLAAVKAGKDWAKIDPGLLQEALAKHVHK